VQEKSVPAFKQQESGYENAIFLMTGAENGKERKTDRIVNERGCVDDQFPDVCGKN
jgi:hypothetical protein